MSKSNLFYDELLGNILDKIHQAQQRAVLSVNRELIVLYWEIGKLIAFKQQQEGWGRGVIPKLSEDIKGLSPEIKGFSTRNIGRMIAFYREYPDADRVLLAGGDRIEQADVSLPPDPADHQSGSFLPQPVAKIETLIFRLPWGHNILLIEKSRQK